MDSIEIAIYNKTKRKMFDQKITFTNIVDYIVFVMEVVEEYSYMLTAFEKHQFAINIAKRIDFLSLDKYDERVINAIIENICKASKTLKINLPKKQSYFAKCFKL